MPGPAGEGVSTYDGLVEDSGDFVVVALRGVEAGEFDDPDAKSRARERLAFEVGRAELEATVSSFRANAEILINEENLR